METNSIFESSWIEPENLSKVNIHPASGEKENGDLLEGPKGQYGLERHPYTLHPQLVHDK